MTRIIIQNLRGLSPNFKRVPEPRNGKRVGGGERGSERVIVGAVVVKDITWERE